MVRSTQSPILKKLNTGTTTIYTSFSFWLALQNGQFLLLNKHHIPDKNLHTMALSTGTETLDAPLDAPREDGEDRTNLIINYLPQVKKWNFI